MTDASTTGVEAHKHFRAAATEQSVEPADDIVGVFLSEDLRTAAATASEPSVTPRAVLEALVAGLDEQGFSLASVDRLAVATGQREAMVSWLATWRDLEGDLEPGALPRVVEYPAVEQASTVAQVVLVDGRDDGGTPGRPVRACDPTAEFVAAPETAFAVVAPAGE